MNQTDKMRKLFAEKALSVDEMEAVAGGALAHCGSVADDSRFLNVLLGGNVCDRYGEEYAGDHIEEIRKAWSTVGVELEINYYYNRADGVPLGGTCCHKINGEYVNAETAYRHAMKVTGKNLKPSDWYWD
ncbi:MAG: hypothetical protein IJS96_05250 [Schwartzia sp.]|nr:hypothetical protein [Schwartzia sp. (in: firmicutes)]